ncbi:threonine/serine exporter family protein [Spirochaetota bacterium]
MILEQDFSLDSVDDALRLSTDAARIVLEAGGETYRAEDVMAALAFALGGLDPDSFATPTGFMASCDDAFGKSHAVVKRIRKRQTNLEKIARINALARDAVAGKIDKDGIEKEICAIDSISAYSAPVPSIGAALVTGFFCLLFGGAWYDALVAALVGVVLGKLASWLGGIKVSDFFSNIVGGAFAALIARGAFVLRLARNPDTVTIGAIMLLVPGVMIVNAIRDMIAGDLVAGTSRLADAFISAAGISIGVGFALHLCLLLGKYI